MTQKDAVFAAVSNALVNAGISFQATVTNASDVLTKELRAEVTTALVTDFTNGSIPLDKEITEPSALRAYVSGLISNWLRKDPRLNGGQKHTVKKSALTSDPQVKALRQLMSSVETEEERSNVKAFLDKRIEELNSTAQA